MKEELAKVMTMVQEGKLDVEKATELLNVMRGNETKNHAEKGSAYNKKMLRVQVVSTE